jgi:tRNA1Val (adenine37-N6)-methyltransferase
MAKPFQYKHFRIEQDKSPMKVGTDGVLIGAWANASKKKKTLDIGTGTGLIALMLAQRFSNLTITGVELHEGAFENARTNFKNSNWSNRLSPILSDLNQYKPRKPFDLIVSNPPFFINSQKNKEEGKTTARHTDSLSFKDLINFAEKNLADNGQLDIILPKVEGDIFIQQAKEKGFFLNRLCKVRPKQYKKTHRLLMSFSKKETIVAQEALTIELQGRHQYSLNYRVLTKDFYLKF